MSLFMQNDAHDFAGVELRGERATLGPRIIPRNCHRSCEEAVATRRRVARVVHVAVHEHGERQDRDLART